jgi:hypothetical protein
LTLARNKPILMRVSYSVLCQGVDDVVMESTVLFLLKLHQSQLANYIIEDVTCDTIITRIFFVTSFVTLILHCLEKKYEKILTMSSFKWPIQTYFCFRILT